MRLYWVPSSLTTLGRMRNIAAVMKDGEIIVVQILIPQSAHSAINKGELRLTAS